MVQSMSRVGRCIDNGPMEGFWGILKSEMYYLRKFSSEQTLTSAIEEYIHFYNTKRHQKRLRCMTPSLTLVDGAFPAIAAEKNLAIRYKAKVSASEAVTNINAATIVFTIAAVNKKEAA